MPFISFLVEPLTQKALGTTRGCGNYRRSLPPGLGLAKQEEDRPLGHSATYSCVPHSVLPKGLVGEMDQGVDTRPASQGHPTGVCLRRTFKTLLQPRLHPLYEDHRLLAGFSVNPTPVSPATPDSPQPSLPSPITSLPPSLFHWCNVCVCIYLYMHKGMYTCMYVPNSLPECI